MVAAQQLSLIRSPDAPNYCEKCGLAHTLYARARAGAAQIAALWDRCSCASVFFLSFLFVFSFCLFVLCFRWWGEGVRALAAPAAAPARATGSALIPPGSQLVGTIPVHQCCYPLARARGAPPPGRAAGDAATAAPGELRGRTASLTPRSRSARSRVDLIVRPLRAREAAAAPGGAARRSLRALGLLRFR